MFGTSFGTSVSAPGASASTSATPYLDVAKAAGIDADRVVHADRAGDIRCKPNTVYAVEGDVPRDRPITGAVDDVAIVSLHGAALSIPAGDRGFDINVSGTDFLLSGVDIDQTAPGAWGRISAGGDRMQVEHSEFIGRGRRANPTPREPIGHKAGPTLSMPATSPSATNIIRGVTLRHGGVVADEHFGDREIGVWLGGRHKGTLRILDAEISQLPNNSIYATACPGHVEIERCVFEDNGVMAGGRIAHGYWKDCDISYDAARDGLSNAGARDHAVCGLGSEQKKSSATGEPGPDVIGCTVRMVSCGKGGTALRAYDIHQDADWGRIEDTDIHVEEGVGEWAADIEIRGGVEAIRNVEMSGSHPGHHSVDNRSDERVVIDGFERDYPSSRKRDKGAPVDWR